jgi:hypothetical protein
MNPLAQRLESLGLLRLDPTHERCALPDRLEALCDEGLLEGGLSVEMDVRPDELLGPLVQQVGGAAASLKIFDVRDTDEGVELKVAWHDKTETWMARDSRALVDVLNHAFGSDRVARAIVVLGEWNDALQLWCVPRRVLPLLQRESGFRPENSLEGGT